MKNPFLSCPPTTSMRNQHRDRLPDTSHAKSSRDKTKQTRKDRQIPLHQISADNYGFKFGLNKHLHSSLNEYALPSALPNS